MLGLGVLGAGALSLPALLRAEASSKLPSASGRAKSCVLLFLWGGPPQQDMWDMKPDAPEGMRSIFKPMATSAPGVQICDQMPQIAKHTDKLCLIRSMTHGSNEHEASCYHVLTGQIDPRLRVPVNQRTRRHFPGPSGVVSRFAHCAGGPTAVTLPRPIMHDGTKYAGTDAGWLGPACDPMELPDSAFDGKRPIFTPDFGTPLDSARLTRRTGLLERLEKLDRRLQADPAASSLDDHRRRAMGLLTATGVRGAFDIDKESDALRDRYGRNHYGESFLLARRLVESGVRLVTLNWMFFRPDGNPLNPWDNHGGTPALGNLSGFDMLKADYCIPPLDQALSALLGDMHQTGLLDETLLVITGEFGRTAKINDKGGREHWGACYTSLLAGAGVRGGYVHGASDAEASYPAEDPVTPEDLLATIYDRMGIPPATEMVAPDGRPFPVSTGTPVRAVYG